MSQMQLAVTMGDPAGVGPELCLKLVEHRHSTGLARRELTPRELTPRELTPRELTPRQLTPRDLTLWPTIPLIFGDALTLQRVADALRMPFDFPVIEWRHWIDGPMSCEVPTIIQCTDIDLHHVQAGHVDRFTGEASFQFVDAAIDAAKHGRVDGIVTGPIHKEAWQQAGIGFPGHTELLATRTAAIRSCMMLTSDEVTCSFVTGHVGLSDVPRGVTCERVLEVIELTAQAMSARLGREARIRVCGLNPHAGEHGLFGRGEEEQFIAPAIEEARCRGIDVLGPLPADTAFLPSLREQTDAYVCMYHDQGLTVLKALAFDRAVNVTLGLPIVRTSVDHGTALDLAWQGLADDRSMREAYAMAASLARHSQVRIDLAAGESH